MKRYLCLMIMIFAAFLAGCSHEHQWADATCVEPKTCTECGETEGEALGHQWVEATCTEAKHCSRCGETEGVPLEHDWEEATCTEAKYCRTCGYADGEPLGHDWADATHEAPKTCKRCGETEGTVLLYDVPSGFTKEYEYGEFSKFNSKASENGLGGTMIWLNGSYENVSTLDISADLGRKMNAFISVLTDQEGNQWLVQIDLDYYTTIEKYSDLCDHSLCILCEYQGFSGVYEMPAVIVEKIYDMNTGNIIVPEWYASM